MKILLVLAVIVAAALTPTLAGAIPITFTDSNGSLSASVTFDIEASGHLVVTLTNTSTADALVPRDVLTGVFFSISGDPILTPYYATLGPGSTVLFAPAGGAGPDVGGEWAYRGGLTGAPGGANQGISSTGLTLFGPGDLFPGSNLQGPTSPDGLQYGITSAGDDPTTGNSMVTGGDGALIQNSVVFELGATTPGGGFELSDISNVSFQYGTALAVPEPGTLMLLGSGLAILGFLKRKRLSTGGKNQA